MGRAFLKSAIRLPKTRMWSHYPIVRRGVPNGPGAQRGLVENSHVFCNRGSDGAEGFYRVKRSGLSERE